MTKRYVCKYCGTRTNAVDCVCENCMSKRPLVRKLVKMLAPYKKCVNQVSKEG